MRGFTAVPIHDIHLRSTREGELQGAGQHRERLRARRDRGVRAVDRVHQLREPRDGASDAAREGGRAAQVRRRHESATDSPVHRRGAAADRHRRRARDGHRLAALEPFAAFVERAIGFDDLVRPEVVAAIVAITLLVAVGAGSYPAFLLSSFNPVRALRGHVARGATAATFRKVLVVLQFSISIALIVATLVVFDQQRFAETFDLGYEKDQVVVLTGSQAAALGPQWESMKRQLAERARSRGRDGVERGARDSHAAFERKSEISPTTTISAVSLRQLMLVDLRFLRDLRHRRRRGAVVLGSERRSRDQRSSRGNRSRRRRRLSEPARGRASRFDARRGRRPNPQRVRAAAVSSSVSSRTCISSPCAIL